MLSAKLGPRLVKVPYQPEASASELQLQISAAFELPPEAQLRLLFKGKTLASDATQDLSGLGLKAGATIMVMHSKASEIEAVQTAKPERMRGFEEGDLRQATGGLGASGPRAGLRARAYTRAGARSGCGRTTRGRAPRRGRARRRASAWPRYAAS